ncbi:hypothetical protein SCANM63S_07484 [Streptomyces canarius]
MARLLLRTGIPNIQTSWVNRAPRGRRRCCSGGAYFGGTMEETTPVLV